MLASGMSGCSLSWLLGLSRSPRFCSIRESTVEFHLFNIFGKRKVDNRRDLCSSSMASELPFWRPR